MHNMIGEDERDVHADIDNWREAPAPKVDMAVDENTRFQQFLTRHREIRDKEAHIALCNALIEHLWEQYKRNKQHFIFIFYKTISDILDSSINYFESIRISISYCYNSFKLKTLRLKNSNTLKRTFKLKKSKTGFEKS
ncbi:hypothetical protein ACOSP7_030407 [Xanthoceras sorbifolium]